MRSCSMNRAPIPTSTATAAPARINIPVTGMTCAACQARVQRVLEREPGVESAAVNLMTNTATVSFDPSVATAEHLVDRIRETGYGASLPLAERSAVAEQESQDAARAEEYRSLRRKALISGVLGAVAMVLSMPLMAANAHLGLGETVDPVMRFVMHRLNPPLAEAAPWLYGLSVNALSYSLLGITLLVMVWAGRDFYTRALNGLVHRSADMNTLIALGTGA